MAAIVPDVSIEDLSIPFGAVALDIESAHEVLFCKGSLRRAVQASSAIPGILPPVRSNGRMLIDGGWVDKIPVLPAFKLGADVVIGVDIAAALHEPKGYTRGVDIMIRANSLKDEALVRFSRRMADINIKPAVSRVHWADFGAFDRCIRAGDEEATRLIPELKEVLRNARLFSFVRPRLGKRLADLYLQSDEQAINIERAI
jgi:NTE family protein